MKVCTSPGADSDGEERGALQVPSALLCRVSQVWRRCGYGQVHTLPNSVPLLLHAQGHPALAAPRKGAASLPSTHTLSLFAPTSSPSTHTLLPSTKIHIAFSGETRLGMHVPSLS